MAKYLLTNLSDTQQTVEYGDKGDLDSVIILPAKSRVTLEINDSKIVELKAKLANVVAFRKL